MHMEICIILPGLFGVCPQTQKVFVIVVKGVNLVKCGSLWGKAIGHLWRESKAIGWIEGEEGKVNFMLDGSWWKETVGGFLWEHMMEGL